MEPDFAIIPDAGPRQLLRSVHAQLRTAILDGRLRAGLRMPSTRTLAQQLGVSRNTVLACYDLLLSEGYLATRARGGTFVADTLPRPRRPAAQAATAQRRLNPAWRNVAAPEAHIPPQGAPRMDFRLGSPDVSALRWDTWQRLAARATRAYARASDVYAAPEGQPRLREAIAGHVSFARAVACEADDLVVTAGIQQALDLLARVLVVPGKTVVAVEDPGYPPARAVFAAAGAKVVPVPVDAEGLVVERLPREARIVYVTPSHQFPLGCVLSMRRRAELLAFAQRHGAVILEDDYDAEFRHGARPLDALQTLDRSASVFYLGTFSKSLFPALRIGYVAAPPWARAALVAAKMAADWHCPLMLQETLASFIAEGHLARHVRKMRRVYAGRHAAVLAQLQAHFDGLLTAVESSAGLHLAALASPRLDVEAWPARALAHGIGIRSIDGYYAARKRRAGLVFGFGAIGEQGIADGLSMLARLVR